MSKSNLTFAVAEKKDFDYILDNLWARGQEEADNYAIRTKEELHDRLAQMAKEHGYVVRFSSGEPVAAFGAHVIEKELYSTWFIATDRFDEAVLSVTKFLRGFIREKIHTRPQAELQLISAVVNPLAPRWFKMLGFEKEGEPKGVFTRYLYKGPR